MGAIDHNKIKAFNLAASYNPEMLITMLPMINQYLTYRREVTNTSPSTERDKIIDNINGELKTLLGII